MSRPFVSSLSGWQETDALARRYGTTPAALLGEADPYRAYCVNQACALAGQALETAPHTDGESGANDPFSHMMRQLGRGARGRLL
jgi:hypothetical protein